MALLANRLTILWAGWEHHKSMQTLTEAGMDFDKVVTSMAMSVARQQAHHQELREQRRAELQAVAQRTGQPLPQRPSGSPYLWLRRDAGVGGLTYAHIGDEPGYGSALPGSSRGVVCCVD